MDINVNVKLSGDPELLITLATLVESIQDVLHVSNAQLAAAEKPAESSNADPQPVEETVVQQPAAQPVAPAANPAPAVPVVTAPAPAVPVVTAPAPAVPTVPTAPAKNYTWAEIQTACAPLIDNGASQQALMALLPKYGVQSLMNIPPARYGELVVDLRALGAKL